MPGNTIVINNNAEYKWYVGDSKMDELIKWLDENGELLGGKGLGNPETTEKEKENAVQNCEEVGKEAVQNNK